jgi:hypothetical protein
LIAYAEEFDDYSEAQVSDKRYGELLEDILNVFIWGFTLANKALPHLVWLPNI